MKLIECGKCATIFSLTPVYNECPCGNAKGFYIDDENIVYSGEDVTILAIDNIVYNMAKKIPTLDGQGVPIAGHICPYYTGSTIRVNDAFFYWYNRKITKASSNVIRKDWDRMLENIRKTNIFKRLLYKIFKKYMFPSFPEYKWTKDSIEWK